MNIILILQLIACVTLVILGFVTLYQSTRKEVHWHFLVFALGTAGWNFSLFMAISELGQPLLWGRLAISFGALMVAGLYVFSALFPAPLEHAKHIRSGVYALGVAFFILTATTDAVVKTAKSIDHTHLNGEFGYFYLIFWMFYLGLLFLSPLTLVFKHRRARGLERRQLKYVIFGFVIFFLPLVVTQFILPLLGIFQFNNLGPLFSIPMIAIIGYAIVRHELMDIKVVIERGLIYSFLLILIISFYLVAEGALSLFQIAPNVATLFSGGLAIILGVGGAQVVEKWFYARKLEERVHERTAQIVQIQKEQKQMMIDISHGLQTPLTVIKSEIHSLRATSHRSAKLEVLEKSIDDVSKFIYDLLVLAKLETTGADFTKEPLNLSGMMNELVEYFQVLAEDQKIKIISEVEPDIEIFGNKDKLDELVTNLVSNAFKYMSARRDKEVFIILKRTDTAALLIIEDNGIGIAKENLTKIFDRFYRIKTCKGKDMPGAGVGLTICKKIVEKHDGTIAVKSELGAGTTFTITFPLKI